MATLQNPKSNGPYPVGGKLHINRDGNDNTCQQKGTPMPTTVLFDNLTPRELRIYNIGRPGMSL